MPEKIIFDIQANDQASTEVERTIHELERLNDSLGKLNQTMNRTSASGNKVKSSFRGTLEGLESLGRASRNVTLALGGIGGLALKTAMDFDKYMRMLKVVTGSQEAATREFQQLQQMAKLPGLDLEPLLQMIPSLQMMGFSFQEASTMIQGFGQAIVARGGDAEELSRAMLQVRQSLMSNRFAMDDIRFAEENMLPVTQTLKEAFGLTVDEIQKQIQSGKSAKEVWLALGQAMLDNGRYAQAAAENMNSPTNAIVNFISALKNLAYQGANQFLPPLQEHLDQLTKIVENLDPQQVMQFAKAFTYLLGAFAGVTVLGTAAGSLKNILDLAGKLAPALTALRGAAGFLQPEFLAIYAAASVLGYALGQDIKAIKEMSAALKQASDNAQRYNATLWQLEQQGVLRRGAAQRQRMPEPPRWWELILPGEQAGERQYREAMEQPLLQEFTGKPVGVRQKIIAEQQQQARKAAAAQRAALSKAKAAPQVRIGAEGRGGGALSPYAPPETTSWMAYPEARYAASQLESLDEIQRENAAAEQERLRQQWEAWQAWQREVRRAGELLQEYGLSRAREAFQEARSRQEVQVAWEAYAAKVAERIQYLQQVEAESMQAGEYTQGVQARIEAERLILNSLDLRKAKLEELARAEEELARKTDRAVQDVVHTYEDFDRQSTEVSLHILESLDHIEKALAGPQIAPNLARTYIEFLKGIGGPYAQEEARRVFYAAFPQAPQGTPWGQLKGQIQLFQAQKWLQRGGPAGWEQGLRWLEEYATAGPMTPEKQQQIQAALAMLGQPAGGTMLPSGEYTWLPPQTVQGIYSQITIPIQFNVDPDSLARAISLKLQGDLANWLRPIFQNLILY